MSYEDLKYPTPAAVEGKFPGSKVLIVGSGPSTNQLIPYKNLIRKYFDSVIVCNYAFKEFDQQADVHLVTEKTSKTSTNEVYKWLNCGKYRTDVVRILNWKGIEYYDTKYNIHKVNRASFCNTGGVDIRRYNNGSEEGLLQGIPGTQGFSLGTVMLCAMHLATILGAKEVYTIGADLCFKDEFDHFYKDDVYRNRPAKVKLKNAHRIIETELKGKRVKTLQYFKESAELIDQLIPTVFGSVKVVDFSDGLLRAPIKCCLSNIFI